MAEARSKVFSIGTTPIFPHTKPPAKLANCDKITESGFQDSKFIDLTFGITSIFLGLKNEE